MANHEFSVKGTLLSRKDQQPLPNLRIEAWDKDLLFDDFVGEATTEANGDFTIIFKLERFRELFFDNYPDHIP